MDNFFVTNRTFQGSGHIRRGEPCEDYSASFTDEEHKICAAVVADGHGDSHCMRSRDGSRMAVEVTLDCLKGFAAAVLQETENGNSSILQDLSLDSHRKKIVRRLTDTVISKWYDAIHEDIQNRPFSEEELAAAADMAADMKNGVRSERAYGTTLIAALKLANYLILFQQGDGRCDVFYANGVIDQPIPWDDRCFQNITTSLCDADAAESVRFCVIDLRKQDVAACWVGCDGIEDSFIDMEGTHCFYCRLGQELSECGVEKFCARLDEELPALSAAGSGDDVSVACIVDTEAIKNLIPLFNDRVRRYKLMSSAAEYSRKLISMTRKHTYLLDNKQKTAEAAAMKRSAQEKTEALAAKLEEEKTELAGLIETAKHDLEEVSELEKDAKEADDNYSLFARFRRLIPDSVKNLEKELGDRVHGGEKKLVQLRELYAQKDRDARELAARLPSLKSEAEMAEIEAAKTAAEADEYDAQFKALQLKLDALQTEIDTLNEVMTRNGEKSAELQASEVPAQLAAEKVPAVEPETYTESDK
jgi:hypothetical protein